MKAMFVCALVLVSSVASAEVKPPKTVLANLCGTPNRSEQFCVGSTVDHESLYLIKQVNGGEPVYMRAERQALNGGINPRYTRSVYRATAVERGALGYRMEVRYELMLSGDRSGKYRATIRRDGASDVTGYDGFEMEPMFHTQ